MATVPQTDQTEQPLSDPVAVAPPSPPPTPTDYRRYWRFRSGISIPDLAAADKVEASTIEASLERVRTECQQFSAEAIGVEVRRLFVTKLPQINETLDESLRATRTEGRRVILIDNETGKVERLEETVVVPDHATRLSAIDHMRAVLSVVQPRDPAVQITNNNSVTANTQHNTLVAGASNGPAGALTSPEAVIRSIVSQRSDRAALPAPSERIPLIPARDGAQAPGEICVPGVPDAPRASRVPRARGPEDEEEPLEDEGDLESDESDEDEDYDPEEGDYLDDAEDSEDSNESDD